MAASPGRVSFRIRRRWQKNKPGQWLGRVMRKADLSK